MKELREAITFRSLGSWFQRLLPLYFTDRRENFLHSFMTPVTCRLTAKNRDQLRNPTLGNRVWATFTFYQFPQGRIFPTQKAFPVHRQATYVQRRRSARRMDGQTPATSSGFRREQLAMPGRSGGKMDGSMLRV